MSKQKILFLSPYPFGKAPSQRLKYEQYYPFFEAAGFEITTSSFIDDDLWNVLYKKGNYVKKIFGVLRGYLRRLKDLLRVRKFDIVYNHLWITPLGLPIEEYFFTKLSKSFVYDIDDMIYLSTNNSWWYKSINGKYKPIVLMKKANFVFTSSPSLQKFVSQYNLNNTPILASYNTEKFKPIKEHHQKEKVVVGWTGTHSTLKYLDIVAPILLSLQQEKNIEFLVISNAPYHHQQLKVKNIKWSAETEFEDLKKIDIGIYPLEKDQWVLGKSGNKALAYMSCGIPCVATAYGTNNLVIQNEIDSFLANTNSQWSNYLTALINDVELRKTVGLAARNSVEKHFSLIANKDKYINELLKLVNKQ